MSETLHEARTGADAPTLVVIAGEASGDQLGGALIRALRQRYPDARIVGVGGPQMQAAGFEAWHDIHELSVMGFLEVLKHLPRLLKLRRSLIQRIAALRPDIVIGIDAPDFNLGLERALKQRGLRTVHYVSPSVWAWREKRAEKIGRSADRVLCLFPMEPEIYARHGVDARFVGHPLADRFPLVADRIGARDTLGLTHDAPVLAVLPGSRGSEVERLGQVFLEAAARVAQALPGLRIVVPAANARCREALQQLIARAPNAPLTLLDGQAHEAMLAADVVLLASGTATLEAMLAKRPMVVGYRVAPLTYRFVQALKLIKTDTFALPNILAGQRLVPELMQDDCTVDKVSAAVLDLFRDSQRRGAIVAAFEALHRELHGQQDGSAAEQAATAIAELLPERVR
ncbi:lipid-A-disaccharide synthase [Oleiagrimonas soli]|uniref:Lipid-A-disaccharide synthase n=1 Tax=Oleiagrimonas soli TaxID=1543381 RepID=A0A099CXN6_9GAMM|nr:lipid-A-disaccharide synthase [Oleiagrimonas soli]KGI77800.1 lipid-A-disaccharide synthase [Oleiagrimonas soli]MBB6183867.1 lipid-A-disaccharide synthase [Oleiagrimonas soli]